MERTLQVETMNGLSCFGESGNLAVEARRAQP